MGNIRSRTLLETEALVVAYAMSRLDNAFLQYFKIPSWRAAFLTLGRKLGVPSASIKNLRDEFDPVHSNPRKGWHKRPLRPNRQRVLGEFCDTSDQALFEIVERILRRDRDIVEFICAPLARRKDRVENVAERLRTGRLAEEYFLTNAQAILGIRAGELVDVRTHACGYDFSLAGRAEIAIEVKGMKSARGDILFTDFEWKEATRRQNAYWLVVVGTLVRTPRHRIIENPTSSHRGQIVLRSATTVSWRAAVAVE